MLLSVLIWRYNKYLKGSAIKILQPVWLTGLEVRLVMTPDDHSDDDDDGDQCVHGLLV